MKNLYPLFLFLFSFSSAFTQTPPFQCSSPHFDISDLPIRFDEHQSWSREVTKLQTVVHVIYYDDFTGFPEEHVEQVIQKVNEDFRRMNPDTIDTPEAFKPVAADTEIEFELAAVDPWGGPTNGITYTQTTHDFFEENELGMVKFTASGGHDAWNPLKYVNIWLVENTISPGIPTTPYLHGDPKDGVVCSDFPFSEFKRNLTHFLGHYLGLWHPFNYDAIFPSPTDTCSTALGGPDGIEDTPNQLIAAYTGSGSGPCIEFPLLDICSPDSPGVMFMNFMDYTLPDCKNMFTYQQAAVMNWVIDSIRFSLLEPVTSIDENSLPENEEVNIYPNPVRGQLIIETHQSSFFKKEYQVFDSTGRPVFKGGFRSHITEIDTVHLPMGVYWLKIKSGDDFFVKRFIKIQ